MISSLLPNNGLQLTALRAAADAGRRLQELTAGMEYAIAPLVPRFGEPIRIDEGDYRAVAEAKDALIAIIGIEQKFPNARVPSDRDGPEHQEDRTAARVSRVASSVPESGGHCTESAWDGRFCAISLRGLLKRTSADA